MYVCHKERYLKTLIHIILNKQYIGMSILHYLLILL